MRTRKDHGHRNPEILIAGAGFGWSFVLVADVCSTSPGVGNPMPVLQNSIRVEIRRGGLCEEAAAPMTVMFVQYLAFMGDLILGVAIWIAPGALGIFAYRLWRKLR